MVSLILPWLIMACLVLTFPPGCSRYQYKRHSNSAWKPVYWLPPWFTHCWPPPGRHRGAAADDGRLKRGDQILAVNGETLEGVTHEQAVAILKRQRGAVILTVLSWASGPDHKLDVEHPQEDEAMRGWEATSTKTHLHRFLLSRPLCSGETAEIHVDFPHQQSSP